MSTSAETATPAIAELVVGSHEDVTFEQSTDKNEQLFDNIVGTLEDLLLATQNDFFEKFYHEFEDKEENKLVYMDIFKQYTHTIESLVDEYLKSRIPAFDMQQFMNMLHARSEQIDGDVFDVLSSLGDFSLFKELILAYKKEKEGMGFDLSGLIVCSGAHQQQQGVV